MQIYFYLLFYMGENSVFNVKESKRIYVIFLDDQFSNILMKHYLNYFRLIQIVYNSGPLGARFSAPVHTSPGAHQAPYTMGNVCLSRS
jgi:hypothetical protein